MHTSHEMIQGIQSRIALFYVYISFTLLSTMVTVEFFFLVVLICNIIKVDWDGEYVCNSACVLWSNKSMYLSTMFKMYNIYIGLILCVLGYILCLLNSAMKVRSWWQAGDGSKINAVCLPYLATVCPFYMKYKILGGSGLREVTLSGTSGETKRVEDYAPLSIKDSWVANSCFIFKKNSTQRHIYHRGVVLIPMRKAKREWKLSPSVVQFSPYAAAPVGILPA